MSNTRDYNRSEKDSPEAKLPNQTRSRITLIAIFMVFFGPIFLAMFLYANLDLWKPSGTSNYGDLMVPIEPLSMLDAVDAESGEAVSVETIEKRWTLIYVAKNGCNLDCEASLFKVRQMRILLGRELARVQYMFLALDEASSIAVKELTSQHPRMIQANVKANVATSQSAAFGENAPGHMFLIDPNGNLVMRYNKDAEPAGMLKDMHRLLKVSKIG